MYNTIIFDLDDTLTDDKENTREAFKIVLDDRKEIYTDEKFEKFYQIDKKTWKDRAEGKLITPYEENNAKKAEWLRAYRFLQYFNNTLDYNEAVKKYNLSIQKFPGNIVAGMFNFEKKPYFEAEEGSNKVPEVNFD